LVKNNFRLKKFKVEKKLVKNNVGRKKYLVEEKIG